MQIIGDGRERLVDLVRERRGHLAHGGQPRQAGELGLQLLELALGRLPLGQVADEAGEEAAVAGPHLADLELHGKGRAVLALAGDDAVDADDALLAGGEVAGDVAVMLLAKGRGHEHASHSVPTTSASRWPNRRSAAALKDWMTPRSSITTVASGTVSRTDRRCASRARRSRAVSRS